MVLSNSNKLEVKEKGDLIHTKYIVISQTQNNVKMCIVVAYVT